MINNSASAFARDSQLDSAIAGRGNRDSVFHGKARCFLIKSSRFFRSSRFSSMMDVCRVSPGHSSRRKRRKTRFEGTRLRTQPRGKPNIQQIVNSSFLSEVIRCCMKIPKFQKTRSSPSCCDLGAQTELSCFHLYRDNKRRWTSYSLAGTLIGVKLLLVRLS